jgi:diguanylate cyclase (GGDEF)-like protein
MTSINGDAGLILEGMANITEHSDKEQVNISLARALRTLLPRAGLCIYLVTEDNRDCVRLWLEARENDRIVVHEPGDDTGDRLSTAQHRRLARCLGDATPLTDTDDTGASTALFPLLEGDHKAIGVLELHGVSLSDAERRLVLGFLRIHHNHLRVLDEGMHDVLTGLLNRRTFDQHLDRILSLNNGVVDDGAASAPPARRHRGTNRKNWLAVFDLDHFKRINDEYGHLYGDEVLLLFANLMRQSFRGYDRLFRFGGEEFVVVLRNVSPRNSRLVFDRFRQRVSEYAFPQIGRVTVSIGYVAIGAYDIPQDIVSKADTALYVAKSNGRNRVCRYNDSGAHDRIRRARAGDVEYFS